MKALVLICLFMYGVHSICQAQFYNLPSKQNYKNAKVGLNNFTRIEGKTLVILKDSISIKDSQTLQICKLGFEEISYLRVQTGTQTVTWALYGGLFMAVSCLSGIIDVTTDPDMELKDNVGSLVAKYIAGGVIIGALIGTAIPKWKTYYIHNKTGYLYPVNYSFYAWKNQVGMTVNLRF
jgi:hypothetical protein